MEDQTLLNQNSTIGYVISGGLEANLDVRLTVPPQEVQEGAFVVIDSNNWRFYGLVTDLRLTAIDEHYANQLNSQRFAPHLAEYLNKQTLFTDLAVMPVLMMNRGPDPSSPNYAGLSSINVDKPTPITVKTIPNHHSKVKLADVNDIAEIFGKEAKTNFRVGSTREQGHPICLNLERFVQRSSGIFGTTGSGKSFLARMILAGMINADQASTLIFDMHNEYGPDTTATDNNTGVSGLKSKFGSKVRLVGLGAGTSFRNQNPDYTLEIAHSDISTEDILLLSESLNLSETSGATLDALFTAFGHQWFTRFMAMEYQTVQQDGNGKPQPASGSIAAWANENAVNVMAAEGLYRKLLKLYRTNYLVEQPAVNGLKQIIDNLENGHNVIISFGNHERDLDFLLVTNLITRKIRESWEKKTNIFESGKGPAPRPLVVVVEEAHILLNREMASQTIFSTIAREMRKYYVTLLIIDQRPSQIYDEVMSQLGTRISGSLGDEDDINAVLSGLPGRSSLRGMLSKLQPSQEMLMLGWGVPMPIPIRSRRYDQQFWLDLLGKEKPAMTTKQVNSILGMDDDSD
jgi:hypothetical protein